MCQQKGVISESSLLNHFILLIHVVFICFQLGKEKPGSWPGRNNTCSFKLRTEASEVFRGMVMANTAKIMRAMNLVMPVSSTIMTGHSRVIDSIAVIKGLLRRSMRVGGGRCMEWFRRCNGWFGVFLFNKKGWGWCVWSG
jgi:hypothetical protein